MRFSRTLANMKFAATPFLIMTAVLALATFSPGLASAQSVSLAPPVQVNFAGNTSIAIVTAQVAGVTGHCAEKVCSGDDSTECSSDSDCTGNGFCTGVIDPDVDGESNTCSVDSECDGGTDDFCSFSGFAVGFKVNSGPNQDQAAWTTTDTSGSAFFLVTDLGGVGHDVIQGCLDVDTSGGVNDEGTGTDLDDVTACINDTLEGGDVASATVDAYWTASISGILGLSPTTAVNPFNSVGHTLTATINPAVKACVGGLNPGMLCLDNDGCGGGLCSSGDLSGKTVWFGIASGPNAGYSQSATTNATGVATKTYVDAGLAGTDTIQACLDLDSEDTSAAECLAENFDNLDVLSNLAYKRWDPVLTLNNKDAIAGTFSSGPAYNPVGTPHTVKAVLTGAAHICFGGNHTQDYLLCPLGTECTASGGTCGVAGYPVFFGVASGPNAGDIPFVATDLTDSTGTVTKTYTDLGGAGTDTIQSCVDADVEELSGGPDDTTFAQCLADYPGEADVPSNTVTKYWLASFVTGGGKWTKPDKSWDSFGGTVGQKPGSTSIVGQWDETAHSSKGGNFSCHWNTFTSLAFSCTNGPCGTTPDTVRFTTANGTCGAGSAVTVTIVDGKKKPDTISVTGATGAAAALNSPFNPLGTGNFTLHK
jgi:hypothetical protein